MSSSERENREALAGQVHPFKVGAPAPSRVRFNGQLAVQAGRRAAESAMVSDDPDTALRAAVQYVREAEKLLEQATSERMVARAETERAAMVLAEVSEARKRLNDEIREMSAHKAALSAERARLSMEQAASAKRQARRASRATAPAAVPDPDNASLRPDPAAATTPADFMAQLRLYKTWSGNPGFRQIAAGAGQRYTASALQAAITRDVLPRKLEMVDTIVQGCGGSDEHRQTWAAAWRRLIMQSGSRMPLALVLEFAEEVDDRSAVSA